MRPIISSIICCLFLMTAVSAGAHELRFATLDWEPYIGKNLKSHGFVAEIVRAAFERGGYPDVKLIFYPWARTLKTSASGAVDGYLPEYYDKAIETNHYFSDPFPGGPVVLFKLKQKPPVIFHTIRDLKPFRIGVVRGYVNTKEFDEADFLRKEPVTNDLQNLKKLLGQRVDLIVIDQFVGIHLLRSRLPGKLPKVEIVKPPLGINPLYVCFSKKRPHALKLRDAFNDGLKKIKQDGTMDRILRSRGF